DPQRRGRELQPALLVAEPDRDVALDLAHAAELVDEVHVPGGAAELAVGGRPQADVLLHLDDLADLLVLDAAQLVRVDAPRGVVLAGLQGPLRGQQPADVIGAARWAGPECHVALPQATAWVMCAVVAYHLLQWGRNGAV